VMRMRGTAATPGWTEGGRPWWRGISAWWWGRHKVLCLGKRAVRRKSACKEEERTL
jgi:hypothetical protein